MKKLTESENLKKLFNKKIILGFLAVIFAMAFIIVTSFGPFIITKEKLASEKFWTDELIVVAITIFAMMSTLFVGQASNAQDPRSQLAKSKVSFFESLALIVNMNAFSQWVKKVLQPQDIQSIKERELRHIGIDDYTILQLEDKEIIALSENAQKYNGRYYSQITVNQAKAVLNLKDGVKHIHLVEPSYYLSVSSIETDKTDSEKSGKEQFVKTVRLLFSLFSKLTLTLIPAIIFAMLARDLNASDIDKAQAWATFIVRMFTLISSSFMGYIVGCQMNDVDADYINLKSRIHKRYLQDTNFKSLTQQEQAKKEFSDRVKKENEDYSRTLGFAETKVENPVIIR